ncbi:MFS transporter [Pseudonocardia sp. NPDC049154]|uniref:MFS transporter n=1 Tax=Pseudonocardia sp. NPDC049154 TaxID=3155501 RepID=UPI00340E1759
MPNPRSSEDHGLGLEVVDPSTVLAETRIHQRSADRLRALQSRGTGYWLVATLALVLLGEQTALSIVFYTPVLADIATTFETAQVVWMLTVFTLASAVLTPLMAKLSDVYGKRLVLVAGAGVSAVGCLICMIAPNFTVLLVGRVLVATTFAFAPLSVALMREVFPVRMRAIAIGLATNGFGLVVIGGPLLAGFVAAQYGVRAIFLMNLILCAVAGLLVLLVVPESPVRAAMRIDYVGSALLGAALFGLLVGLTQIQTLGLGSPIVLVCLVGGVLAALGWWAQQKRAAHPLISVKLLTRKPILITVLAVLAYCGVSNAMNYLVALQWSADPSTGYGHGLTALEIGLWSIPAGALTVVAGILAGATVRSVGYRIHMIVAGVLWAVPAALLGLNLGASPAFIIVVYGLFGLANIYSAASAGLILLAAPADQRGVASGMNYALQGIGGAVVSQITFLCLNASVGSVVGGVPVYEASGFRNAFLAAAVVAALGIVAAVAIPHGRRLRRQDRPVNDETVDGVPVADAGRA